MKKANKSENTHICVSFNTSDMLIYIILIVKASSLIIFMSQLHEGLLGKVMTSSVWQLPHCIIEHVVFVIALQNSTTLFIPRLHAPRDDFVFVLLITVLLKMKSTTVQSHPIKHEFVPITRKLRIIRYFEENSKM